MDEKEILARLVRLEKAVFGDATRTKSDRDTEAPCLLEGGELGILSERLRPLVNKIAPGDRLYVQAIQPKIPNRPRFMMVTTYDTLFKEEDDESVARCCSVLGSRPRLTLLKTLTKDELTSGELVEVSGMVGGHLHHHLRDLMALRLIEKTSENKYRATELGIYAYMTVAALHRHFAYGERTQFSSLAKEISEQGEEPNE